ncbi:MAG: prepilin-type N-terminal cleavage/methylation domain-containing protein [Phycisphaerae bacterium]|nr:prepilin-type N-terminal cleavage/methylation domain-containing protein [Phycisphaerae bacterium]
MISKTGQKTITSRPRRVSSGGFTLLELILVMIILCTVLGMAAPSLRGFFSSRQINDAAEHLVAVARYAKVQSVYQSRPYRLNFERQENDAYEYWLSSIDASEYKRLENDFGNRFKIPKGIEVDFEKFSNDGGISYVDFSPQGYSRECRIELQDESDNFVDVVCYGPAENFELVELKDGKRDVR